MAASSAIAKFERAQHHFDVLRGEVDAFLDPESYRIRPEPNSDSTEYRFYIDFATPMPSTRWGLIFGDGVHCLRSALDHCVYAIGVKESGSDPPPDGERLEFPITDNIDRWNERRRRLKSLSDDAQAAIKRLQPHDDSEEFALRPLGMVQEFDNADKHRSVRIVVTVPEIGIANVSGLLSNDHATFDVHFRPVEHDAPFATLTLDRPNPNVKVRHNLTLQVGIPRIRRDGKQSTLLLWPCVGEMSQAISNVLAALEKFC